MREMNPTTLSARRPQAKSVAPLLRGRRWFALSALRQPGWGRVTGLVLAGSIVLTGCANVRAETPPPREPVPDAVELVRRTAADNAVTVATLASNILAAQISAESEPGPAELQRIDDDAAAHLAALGGVYVSGLPDDAAAQTSAGEPVETVMGGYLPLIQLLNQSAARNLNAAATDSNGDKARLLASIGTSQALAAARLAGIQGMPDYEPISQLISSGWLGGAVAGEVGDGAGDDAGDGDAVIGAGGGGHDVGELGAPEGTEATGITVADFQAIVKSEDAARYAFEVFAARSEGDLRTALRQRARVHGARAQAWAVLGQIAETDQDPRLVAYQVPFELSPAELVLYTEKGLSDRWAALIAAAAPGAREPLIEALLASQFTVAAWGGAIATFPGIPELEGQFGAATDLADTPRIPYEWAAELEEPEPPTPVE